MNPILDELEELKTLATGVEFPAAASAGDLLRRVSWLRSVAATALSDLSEEEFSEFHFELDALENALMA